jgi:8-oxo-dGTP pyrophosphatase MutT (NUDIX family)
MAEFAEEPSPAATVLLLRDRPAFEVLMIARAEKSTFAGGALVFPGGRVDPSDHDPRWREQALGLSGEPRVAAAQVAAIREAYEEVGVLLARDRAGNFASASHAISLSDWRATVEKNDALFLDLMRREELVIACDALQLFAHWIAPPGLHKRFDTLFFAAAFPTGQQVLEDGNEATEALWIAPNDAVAASRRGERKIIFPTARNLELLGVSKSVAEAMAFAKARPIRPVMPSTLKRDGDIFLKIPDDLGYPITEEKFDSARRG